MSCSVAAGLPLPNAPGGSLSVRIMAYTGDRMVACSLKPSDDPRTQSSPLRLRTRTHTPPTPPPPDKPRKHPSALTWWWLRQGALVLALAALVLCYAGPLKQDATEVLASKRVLPVYSVEREDKVISVSFDASWGGDKTLRIQIKFWTFWMNTTPGQPSTWWAFGWISIPNWYRQSTSAAMKSAITPTAIPT